MARNVEIKARLGPVGSIERIEPQVAAIAGAGPTLIAQDDRFFACPHGRLKLRVFADGRGELIFYQRADEGGPKTSFYRRSEVGDPESMGALLAQAHGEIGRVRKQRWLYLVGRTRVHLDRVEGLDDHLELEVVLTEGEAEAVGVAEAHGLMHRLGLGPDCLVRGAYLDLLRAAPPIPTPIEPDDPGGTRWNTAAGSSRA